MIVNIDIIDIDILYIFWQKKMYNFNSPTIAPKKQYNQK